MHVLAKTSSAALLILISPILLSSCNYKRSYASYEDCILGNVESDQSRAVVEAIRDACRRKFPPTAEEIAEDDAFRAAQFAQDMAAADAAQAAADTAAAAADAVGNSDSN